MPASVDVWISRRDAFAALERAVERVEGLLDEDEAAAQAPLPLSFASQLTLLAAILKKCSLIHEYA